MGQVRTSQDIPGPKGIFVTWDFGHCSRWDKSGHPGISRDVKGHFRPGTLGIVLGGTKLGHPGISRDVKGHLRPGTLGIVLGGTSQDIPGYPGM